MDRNAIPKTALAPSVPFDVQPTTHNITTPSGVDNVVAQQPDPRDHHTEVLETAHAGTVLNEAELIELVTSGQYPCTVDPVTGNLEVSLQLFNGQSVQQSEERKKPYMTGQLWLTMNSRCRHLKELWRNPMPGS